MATEAWETRISTPDGTRRCRGFCALELLVSLALLAVVAGVLTPVLSNRRAASRDARRLRDLKSLVEAVERYLLDTGSLPKHDAESGNGGWDTSLDAAMVTELVDAKYLREPLRDPVNDKTYHYRYHRYDANRQGFASRFYVAGIRNWETTGYAETKGGWKGTSRDWSSEFAFCTGGIER